MSIKTSMKIYFHFADSAVDVQQVCELITQGVGKTIIIIDK